MTIVNLGNVHEVVNALIEIDSQHNVKITYDKGINCTVEISEYSK